MFHHMRPQNDTLGFFGRKYLSEQHWQMRQIRLHGCTYSRAILVAVTLECWSETFGTLANSADPDQTPQNAGTKQGLHYLHEEVKG